MKRERFFNLMTQLGSQCFTSTNWLNLEDFSLVTRPLLTNFQTKRLRLRMKSQLPNKVTFH